jgi:archaeosortase B (VPXXXP-CTERM-specific)
MNISLLLPKRNPARSLIIFAISLAGCVSLLLLAMNAQTGVVVIEKIFAHSSNFILRLLGNETRVVDQTIWSRAFYLEVIAACTGVYPLSVYTSAVIAYPSSWVAKLAGFGLGITGLFLLNIIRLVSVFYVGVYFPRFLDDFHLLVWQSLVVFCTLLLWLFWAKKVTYTPCDA